MKILACFDDPVPAGGECVNSAWIDYAPGLLDGITWEQVGQITGPLLVLGAIVVVLGVLLRWAQSDINL